MKRREWATGLMGELRKYEVVFHDAVAIGDWGRVRDLADELSEFAEEVRHAAKSKEVGL